MHIYRITGLPYGISHDKPRFAATLGEAHQQGKLAGNDCMDVLIELFDLPTDKDSLVNAINFAVQADDPIDEAAKPLRTWELTRRGGLKEITE